MTDAQPQQLLALEQAQRDAVYQALGHYVVQFSVLVAGMRRHWAAYLAGDDAEKRELLEMSYGNYVGSSAIADAFFAACKQAPGLGSGGEPIRARLSTLVEKAGSERNNMMHGDSRSSIPRSRTANRRHRSESA